MRHRLSVLAAAMVIAAGSLVWVAGQRLGGFKEVATDNEGVVAAADFAVEEQSRRKETTYKLESVEKAEQQVVAGMNYRLCLKVSYQKEGEEEETSETVRVVVSRNLQGEHSLTSWAQEDCGEGNSDNLKR